MFLQGSTHTRLLLTAVAITILLPGIASAQFVNAKYAGEFLSLGVGARSAGLGGAGTGYSNDVTAAYFNPAALNRIDYPQLAIFHEARFAGEINYDYAGAALPFGQDQTFALSAIRIGIDGIKDSRNALIDRNGNGVLDEDDRIDPDKIVEGSAADWAVYASYARRMSPKFSLGGSLKFLHRSVLDASAWGVGIDVGAAYTPDDHLRLGATVADATKSLLSWNTGHQEFIVPTLRLGAAYRYDITDDHSIMPVVDGIFRFEGRSETTTLDLGIASFDPQVGLEYSFKDRVYIRGGYSELGQFSAGAGIKLPKLNIDYAFIGRSPDQDAAFGPSHRISLMLTLEEPRFAR